MGEEAREDEKATTEREAQAQQLGRALLELQMARWLIARQTRVDKRLAVGALEDVGEFGAPAQLCMSYPPSLAASLPCVSFRMPVRVEQQNRLPKFGRPTCKDRISALWRKTETTRLIWRIFLLVVNALTAFVIMVLTVASVFRHENVDLLGLNPTHSDNKFGRVIYVLRLVNYGVTGLYLLCFPGAKEHIASPHVEAFLVSNGYRLSLVNRLRAFLHGFFLLDWVSCLLLVAGMPQYKTGTLVVCGVHIASAYFSCGYFNAGFESVFYPESIGLQLKAILLDIFLYDWLSLVVMVLSNVLLALGILAFFCSCTLHITVHALYACFCRPCMSEEVNDSVARCGGKGFKAILNAVPPALRD